MHRTDLAKEVWDPSSRAGFWRRLVASVLDFTAFSGFSGIPFWVWILALAIVSGYVDLPLWLYVPVAILPYLFGLWLFYAGSEGSRLGGTPGKIAMGLVVTDAAGDKLTTPRSSLRLLARVVVVLTAGLGYLAMLASPRRIALHDRLTATRVVRTSRSVKARVVSLGICVIGATLLFGPVARWGEISTSERERGRAVFAGVTACDEIVDELQSLAGRLVDEIDSGADVDVAIYLVELDEVERQLNEISALEELADPVRAMRYSAKTLRSALNALDSASPDPEVAKHQAFHAALTTYAVSSELAEVLEEYTAPVWPIRLLLKFLGMYEESEPDSAPPPGVRDALAQRAGLGRGVGAAR